MTLNWFQMVKIKTRHPIEGSFGNEFPSVCNHCGVMAAWSHKTLEKNSNFCFFFWKMTPYGKIFKNVFWQDLLPYQSTCYLQILWNLADGKSVKWCIAYLTKKNKFSPRCPVLTTVRIAPEICQGQPQTMYSQCSRFYPNRFTFSGVVFKCVNTVTARAKVNPIFGWSLASSRIITMDSVLNLGACQLLPPNSYSFINCSNNCFCTCVHRHDCQYQPFFNSQLTHCPSHHFSWNPIKSLLQIHKAKTELPSFNSKILLHLSYNKNGISGSFTFTNPNCRSSTSICCRIPCSKILSTTFIACSNNLILL